MSPIVQKYFIKNSYNASKLTIYISMQSNLSFFNMLFTLQILTYIDSNCDSAPAPLNIIYGNKSMINY